MVHFSHFHLYISIHAPTRGATKFKRTSCNNYNISIHAPTRGATVYLCYYDIFHLYFNPRSHEGSDGRTSFTFFFSGVFQSTLPRGERLTENMVFIILYRFQSTLPRGERRMPFNAYALVWNISIHAPTRGATKYSFSIFRYVYFNPRSHEGSDARFDKRQNKVTVFQSTLPRGERRGSFFSGLWGIINFNPRSHEGSDDICLFSNPHISNFNPRSHEGSDQVNV